MIERRPGAEGEGPGIFHSRLWSTSPRDLVWGGPHKHWFSLARRTLPPSQRVYRERNWRPQGLRLAEDHSGTDRRPWAGSISNPNPGHLHCAVIAALPWAVDLPGATGMLLGRSHGQVHLTVFLTYIISHEWSAWSLPGVINASLTNSLKRALKVKRKFMNLFNNNNKYGIMWRI